MDFTEELKKRRGHAGAISIIALNNKSDAEIQEQM